jgi:hypothetical protein
MKGQLSLVSLAFELKMQLEIIQIDPDGGSRTFHDFLPYIFDDLVESHFHSVFIIPLAGAGIQLNQAVLGSRLRGSDGLSDFLRVHHIWPLPANF